MSDLPVAAQQAGALLQSPLALQDGEYREMIIRWGYEQIEREYPLDPIRAPLNVVRRKAAMMEWEHTIRTQGRELRNVVAGAAVEELNFQLERRRQQILAKDAQDIQRSDAIFYGELRIKEGEYLAAQEHQRAKELLQLQHQLAQEAEDEAMRRRIREATFTTEAELYSFVVQEAVREAGILNVVDMIEATQKVNAEITRIRRDTSLSADEQHIHIKSLLDTLPAMLRTMQDRGDRGRHG